MLVGAGKTDGAMDAGNILVKPMLAGTLYWCNNFLNEYENILKKIRH